MDSVRPPSSVSRRTGSLLALALVATTVLTPALTPALAGTSAARPAPPRSSRSS
jgi:hypothetical protein